MTEYISYDLFFKKEWVKPGSKLKIKGKWKSYTYINLVCFGELQDTWIACEDSKGMKVWFRPGEIKKVIGKRSYQKNV